MKIGIDIRSTLKQKTGIGYYTLNLINSLGGLDKINKYLLYSKIKPFSRDRRLPSLPGSNFRHVVDRFGVGPPAMLKGADVIHTSSFDLKPPKGAKFVVTVHDIIPKAFPQGHTKDAIKRLEASLTAVLSAADVIVADTRSSASDLTRFYPAEYNSRIRVVYPGVGEDFGVLQENSKALYKSVLLRYNIPSNYITYVGTIEPRKNVLGLIEAYNILKKRYAIKHQLVIAGMKGWLYEEVFRRVEDLGLSADIVFTGYVPREELKVFYNFADLCVYPSFYEGAGLPVLEAFACGCPVVTSNVSSMPELAGDAAVLIDPYNTDSIAEGIYKILSNEELKTGLRQKGLKRAGEFTWERTARQMLEIFKSPSLRGVPNEVRNDEAISLQTRRLLRSPFGLPRNDE